MDEGLVGSMSPTFYSEQVSAEAGAWLARLHASDLSAQDEAAFQVWLASDPAHAAAFEHATNVWDRLGAIPRDAYVPKKKDLAIVLSRRALIAGAAGIAVFGSSIPFWGKAQARSYQTAVGEQRRVPLVDGSMLFLDTNTSLTVDFGGSRRLVDLQYGRVNCRVVQNDRQFAVKAGDRLLVGNRSVFDLSNSQDFFSVVLIDGNAELRSSANSQIELRQGDRATATQLSPLRRDRPDLSLLTSWQTGRLVFRDETVSDAVEEVNRYSTVKIEVDDPNIASLHMSGGYVVGDTFGFADSLSKLLPIEVSRVDGKIKLISRRDI
jgi:transmembrane sensor